jgi:U4/U6.U5 tri-snRNP-associated protein 1
MSDEIDSGVLEVTLNLEDSNALREKLGLKPLNNKPPDQSKKEYDAWKKEKELAEKDKEVEKLMEKIFESREKRELTKKFESMKSIGDVENLAEYEAKKLDRKIQKA